MAINVIFHRRNPLRNNPLLFKGGAHRKTNKSKRRMEKVKMKKEWLPENIFLQVYFGEAIHFLGHRELARTEN
jgi:hypothetical protein